MSKYNIIFDNNDYIIDESSLSNALTELQSHLSNVMNGSGTVIKLGGVSYNIDSAKLSSARNDFVSHLGKIQGTGKKVVIGGVTYNIGSDKVQTAVTELETVLRNLSGGLESGDDSESLESYVGGLYQTGAVARYEAEGADAISDMLITSWDELVSSGAIVINDGSIELGYILPDNLPEKNEYGFYFGVKYYDKVFHEDGSCTIYDGYDVVDSLPAGSCVYGNNSIDISKVGWGHYIVYDNGLAIMYEEEEIVSRIGKPFEPNGDLIIPSDSNITIIGNGSFYEKYGLTGIVIPEGVTNIDDYAFAWSENLTNVVIPNSVTNIGMNAFNGCYGLTSIVIPEGVNYIGNHAFAVCENLTNVVIPNSVTRTGTDVFADCYGLTSIVIPEGLTSINSRMFYYCENLTNVVIPNSVTSIYPEAFCGCNSLTSIAIPKEVTSIYNEAFVNCKNLTSILYNGSVSEWNKINFGSTWFPTNGPSYSYTPVEYTVYCTDGNINA